MPSEDEDRHICQLLAILKDSVDENAKISKKRFDGMDTQITKISTVIIGSMEKPEGLVHRLNDVEKGQVDIKKRLDDHDKIELERLHNSSTVVPFQDQPPPPQPATMMPTIGAKEGGIIVTIVTAFSGIIYSLIQFFKSHH